MSVVEPDLNHGFVMGDGDLRERGFLGMENNSTLHIRRSHLVRNEFDIHFSNRQPIEDGSYSVIADVQLQTRNALAQAKQVITELTQADVQQPEELSAKPPLIMDA